MTVQKQAPAPANRVAQAQEKNALDMVLEATERAMSQPEAIHYRIDNEQLMAESRAKPRDMNKIKQYLTSLLQEFPNLAEDAIYNKPVGKDPATGEMAFARDLSIDSAETLAEAYGFNRIRSSTIQIDDDHVKIEASFTDLQTGRIKQDDSIVAAFYRNRGGAMVRIAEDRFLNMTVKAEKSKVIREVILRSMNAGLKAWWRDLCEKTIDTLLDDATVQKIVGQFSTKGVSLEQLERVVGKPIRSGWTKLDRSNLLGLWNSIKAGETTIAEAFGTQEKPPTSNTGNGAVSGSDLSNPKPPETTAHDADASGQAVPDDPPRAPDNPAIDEMAAVAGSTPLADNLRDSLTAQFQKQFAEAKDLQQWDKVRNAVNDAIDQLGEGNHERLMEFGDRVGKELLKAKTGKGKKS